MIINKYRLDKKGRIEMKNNKNDEKKKTSYAGLGIALGPAFGFLLSLILDGNIGFWMAIGVSFGLVFGSIADAKAAEKDERAD